ncbi:MAG: NAD-dependent succinate-semialdehyde dehydrogenase [Paenibacillaceae bacterium]|jgi:acyl-CoA reductase-like NAD-dependent aldehyde dehydrogenase|nr:NAD-dependent succinate-semialdehyde dehydrogenase [Paenibacillaceae bacterium]
MKQYINGNTCEGLGEKLHIVNPATEAEAGELATASRTQAEEALAAAAEGFKAWSGLSLNQRSEWIHKLAAAIEEEKETILDLLISETGKPLDNAEYDYGMLIQCLRYFPEEAKRLCGSIIPDYDGRFRHLIQYRPLGVVVGYLAWNFPLLNLGYKLGPALASGCSCVLKPSSRTPLATLYIGAIAKKINFPAGVFNIVAGSGKEIGEAWNTSTIPKMITLIGSSETGRELIRQSATSIKHFSLELGGNAPAIVMKDADLANAAKQIVDLKFTNVGQVCVSPNRVFVHADVHDEFLAAVAEQTQQIRLGAGRDPQAQMGPMISAGDRQRVLGLVEEAVAQGAKLIVGGTAPESPAKGFYLSPTVVDQVRPEMRICREEIFGPVMTVQSFTDRDEVVREANNTPYGLAAYVFTSSLVDAFELSEKLEAGSVSVNEPFYAVHLPHGGVKESGIGKDCSKYSLEEYYAVQRISIRV